MNESDKAEACFPFNCPYCRQSLEATPDLVGQKVDCPGCGKEITVPTPPGEGLAPQRTVYQVPKATRLRQPAAEPEAPAEAEKAEASGGESPAAPAGPPAEVSRVVVTGVDMPFGNMVAFMIKWAIASIPAAIALMIIGGLVLGLLAVLFRTLFPNLFP